MWKHLKRICKDNCIYIFFTTTKYGIEIINSNKLWFRYDLVWEKHKALGFLNANKMPLRAHEMIYIFTNQSTDDVERIRNLELREYSEKVFKYINKTGAEIDKVLGNECTHHFRQYRSSQFSLPTEKTYNKLIELYNIDKMEGFIKYEDLKFEKYCISHIYNPQKTSGKPYKTKGSNYKDKNIDIYGGKGRPAMENKTGDRHPRSVLKYHQKDEKLHPTQKPLELCEWLIKSYSNEGDIVLDFCMGSGTTIKACINTKRNYIGIEKDKDIFNTAKKRIEIC
jgi:DNA modification methylase